MSNRSNISQWVYTKTKPRSIPSFYIKKVFLIVVFVVLSSLLRVHHLLHILQNKSLFLLPETQTSFKLCFLNKFFEYSWALPHFYSGLYFPISSSTPNQNWQENTGKALWHHIIFDQEENMAQVVCSHFCRSCNAEIAADSVCGTLRMLVKPAETGLKNLT